MDAAALLKAQGWRGKGYSLHPTNNAIGLSKPLLLSKNTDGRGIGQKPHYTSDQWWLNAFDEKLKGLNTSKNGAVVQSVTKGKLDVVANCSGNGKYSGASGLYASFVRGGTLEGTLTPETTSEESTDATPASEDRDPVPGLRRPRSETKEENRARQGPRRIKREEKAAKRAAERKAAKKAAKKEARRAERVGETNEERRKRRAERRIRKEEKRKRRATSGTSAG